MSTLNLSESIQSAAEVIKLNTTCERHGSKPDYKLIKTSKGANVQWSCCCDTQLQLVERKLAMASVNLPGHPMESKS